MIHWAQAFQTEIGEPADDTEVRVDRSLAAGEFWVWEDGRPSRWPLLESLWEAWFACPGSTHPQRSGIVDMRPHAFTRFRSTCMRPGFAAYSIRTSRIRLRIPFTDGLGIRQSQRFFAIDLSEV